MLAKSNFTGLYQLLDFDINSGYTFKRVIDLNVSIVQGSGIAACVSCGYLYFAELKNKSIYRLNLNTMSRDLGWHVNFADNIDDNDIITTYSACNLIVVSGGNAVYHFTRDGDMFDNLTMDIIVRSQSAISLPTGEYVVAHDNIVSLFNIYGNRAIYSGLNLPKASSVLLNGGYLLIADPANNRIALLSSYLSYIRDFVSSVPARHMWLDQTRRLLYASTGESQLVYVYSLRG